MLVDSIQITGMALGTVVKACHCHHKSAHLFRQRKAYIYMTCVEVAGCMWRALSARAAAVFLESWKYSRKVGPWGALENEDSRAHFFRKISKSHPNNASLRNFF